ncbi:MAG TPA: hypothetical protein VHK91_13640, partial [Flavisolibacter sp.]|nr:hypothetical protein [Flavisolibacter sp.]
MKYLKYSWCALVLLSLVSCLKPKNELAGLRTDKGGIVVSIAEAQYVNTDAQVTQFGWSLFANFNFAAR